MSFVSSHLRRSEVIDIGSLGGFPRRSFSSFFCFPIVVLLLFFAAGCANSPVAQDVSQEQANEIIAVLANYGIGAESEKERGGRGVYRVEVRKRYYSQAISLLHERGLPRAARQSIEEMVTPQGLIPNSRQMESLRLDRALAREIEELLSRHPSVSEVSATVRLNYKAAEGVEQGNTQGVALVLTKREGQRIVRDEVIDLVTKVVPGITREQISLVIQDERFGRQGLSEQGVFNGASGQVVPVPLTEFMGLWRVSQEESRSMALTLAGGIIVIFILGSIVGYWYAFYRTTKESVRYDLPELGVLGSKGKGEKPRQNLPPGN